MIKLPQRIVDNYLLYVSVLVLIILCLLLLLHQETREEEVNSYWQLYINTSCICIEPFSLGSLTVPTSPIYHDDVGVVNKVLS